MVSLRDLLSFGSPGSPWYCGSGGCQWRERHGRKRSMSSAERPKHFSMIRGFHLADVFTLGNAACGVASLFLAMAYLSSGAPAHFLAATAMAPAAFVFDVFDG